MSIIQEINEKMPAVFDLSDAIYQAIIGKVDFTPELIIDESSDYKCGAIANEYEYLRRYIDDLAAINGIDAVTGGYLDILVGTFLTIRRFYSEPDDRFRLRFYSLVRRNGNLRWDTPWAIVDVFSYFFSRETLFLVENPPLSNLIINPGFELIDMSAWVIVQSGGSTVERALDYPFQGSYSMVVIDDGSSPASFAQTVEVDSGAYSFGCMVKAIAGAGNETFELRMQMGGQYYNFATRSWGVTQAGKVFGSSNAYTRCDEWIIVDSPGDLTVSLHTIGVSCSYSIDYVEFGVRPDRPTLRMTIQTQGQSGDFMNLFPGDADPVVGADYANASYLDQSFIGGSGVGLSQNVFTDILRKIKSAGVVATIEIAT